MLSLVVMVAFVFLLLAMSDVRAARAVSRHPPEEDSTALEVRNLMIDVESSQRGFIITGDPSFLVPWVASRRALPQRAAALAAMADDPGQATRAKQLETDALAYLNDYAVPLVDAARRGDNAVRSREVSEDGERRMEALRHEVDTYNATESELSIQQQIHADRAYRRSTLLAGGGLVVCVVAIGLITGTFRGASSVRCGESRGWRSDSPVATSQLVCRKQVKARSVCWSAASTRWPRPCSAGATLWPGSTKSRPRCDA